MSHRRRQTKFDTQAFANRLDVRRRELGLTWRRLAAELDISASCLTRFQQGQRPDVDTLFVLLLWLNADWKDFYTEGPGEIPDNEARVRDLLAKTEDTVPALLTVSASTQVIKRVLRYLPKYKTRYIETCSLREWTILKLEVIVQ